MAKAIWQDELTAADMQEFVADNSSFQFEMEVLALIRHHGFESQHSGTYLDPFQNKLRQYDIRASCKKADAFLQLTVECKTIQPNSGLLISCSPRKPAESSHCLIGTFMESTPPTPKVMSVWNHFYRHSCAAGRQTDRVVRTMTNGKRGDLESSDTEIYDKWSQAINSAIDLATLHLDHWQGHATAIIPMLVVPDGRLWGVAYPEGGGSPTGAPKQEKRISCHVGVEHNIPYNYGTEFIISHLEVVTLTGLSEFLIDHKPGSPQWQELFHDESVVSLYPSPMRLARAIGQQPE